MQQKLIVILGPTAAGKSALAVQLAKNFNGEIISADSRQVYKGLNIGTGKITQKEMMDIPHHLLSVASPKRRFTVSQYRSRAIKAMASIARQGKLPILVGGSPFYIYSVVDGWTIPEVKPNLLLRKKLEKLPVEKLFLKLKQLDPRRAKTLRQNSGQAKNKRRLIRALEIVLSTGKPVPPLKTYINTAPWYNNDVLVIGVRKTPKQLHQRIRKRFLYMIKRGFLAEVKRLRKQGLSWKRIEDFGLEYREASQYLQGKIRREEMIEKAIKATEDFSRRQMTWFKKDQRIHWVQDFREAQKLLKVFLKSL